MFACLQVTKQSLLPLLRFVPITTDHFAVFLRDLYLLGTALIHLALDKLVLEADSAE